MKKILILLITSISIYLLSNPVVTFAGPSPSPTSSSSQIGCGGNFGIIAKFVCGITGDTNAQATQVGNKLNAVLSGVINFLTIVAAIWVLFQLILAGFQWIGSAGDKEQVTTARDKITWSIIGLIVVVISYLIIGVIGGLLGIPVLNPGEALKTLLNQL